MSAPTVSEDRTTIHIDAATALLAERAARWQEDEPARLILQMADRCDGLHRSVLRGVRKTLQEYEVFARGFGRGDLRYRPPAEGSSGSDIVRHVIEYECDLLALQMLVRAVLGVALELPKVPSRDVSPPGGTGR